MKIFLPFHSQGIGGTSVFAERFKAGMEQRGHEVFFEPGHAYDVLFLVVQAPFKYLWEARKKKIPIIQRLDGSWYWSVVQWRFPLYNAKAAIIRHFFTTFTIYQSLYSRYCSNIFLGKKQIDLSTIIYNGVDLNLFTPQGPTLALRDNPEQILFFSSSAFRREDQIVPIIEALKIYAHHYTPNFKFLIAGTFTGKASSIPEKYREFKQLAFLGRIPNTDLPAYERTADVYVITHLNPPCPNNVIEALACGLPIGGINDGAMSELVLPEKTGLLLPTEGDAFWKKRKINSEAYAALLHELVQNKEKYKTACRQDAEERFSLERMLEQYETALKTTLHL